MTARGGQTVLLSKVRVPEARGLARARIDQLTARLWEHRLGLVIAPAGSGKTTLLAQFAASAGVPVGWYRAEAEDRSEVSLTAHLEQSLCGALDGLAGGWAGIDDGVAALDDWGGGRALLVVDDLHALHTSPAEGAVERLVQHLPPAVTVLVASRRAPGFDLSRMRVSGELLEIGADDLRFRSWEVEGLFRDYYGDPLPPQDLAELARRTEGWAAGLQLFHLATTGKSRQERRRVLGELASRSRLVREYLARNVLDELDTDLRQFLLHTCVLGRLTPSLCDALTGRHDSEHVLCDLERRQIFTQAMGEERTWRYHEVLRSHLEAVLADQLGDERSRECYQRAGRLLEDAGALPEALRAYCRGEDGEATRRVLAASGEQVVDGGGPWIDALPSAVVDHDPWLLLAGARRAAAEGRWEGAIGAYQRAESAFGGALPAERCRRERLALTAWFQPVYTVPTDWPGLVRLASRRDPAAVGRRAALVGGPAGLLASGLGALLAGHVRQARHALAAAANHPEASPVGALGADLAAAVAALLAGEHGVDLVAISERADDLGQPWLGGMARAGTALLTGAGDEEPVRSAGDAWGSALAALLSGLGGLFCGRGAARQGSALERAAADFRHLGAAVLEAWASAGAALARAEEGAAGSLDGARRAESLARATGTAGALVIALTALAVAEPGRAVAHALAARSLGEECGLAVGRLLGRGCAGAPGPAPGETGAVTRSRSPGRRQTGPSGLDEPAMGPGDGPGRHAPVPEGGVEDGDRRGPGDGAEADEPAYGGGDRGDDHSGAASANRAVSRVAEGSHDGRSGGDGPAEGPGAEERAPATGDGASPMVLVRCFGSFRLEVGGRSVDTTSLKPRHQALLHLLAMGAGRPVHREQLVEALWPVHPDPRAAARNLHVAVSSLRRLLEPDAARGASALVVRDGDSYRLAVGPHDDVDVRTFERSLDEARAARAPADGQRAEAALMAALRAYTGELLPGDGPAEWVVKERDRYRMEAANAAQLLAEVRLADHRPRAAAMAAERGVRIDRYVDALWRLLPTAYEQAGDVAAAARARRQYAEVLDELGVRAPGGGGGAGASVTP